MEKRNGRFSPCGNDFDSMLGLLREDYAVRTDGFTWLTSRLEYWRFGIWHEKKYIPTFWAKNAQLWHDGSGALLGFAISEEGDENFTVVVKPTVRDLYPVIVDWVKSEWKPRGRLCIEINSGEEWKREVLEAAGFRGSPTQSVTRKYDLQGAASRVPRLESPFGYRDMTECSDYTGKLRCTRNAFRNRDIIDFDFLVNEYFIQAPDYDRFLDVSVVNGDGFHVSGCIAWPDYGNGIAEIETVATHSDYRRRGFAEAVIRECMRRLSTLGIRYAYITGWNETTNGLYEKLGPVSKTTWTKYELP